jgi:hypothetical protein
VHRLVLQPSRAFPEDEPMSLGETMHAGSLKALRVTRPEAVASCRSEHRIILAADVAQQANDVRRAVPMVDQARASPDAAGVPGAIEGALGDAGYYSEQDAKDPEQRGIEAYLATERLKHHEEVAAAPRGRIPDGLTAKRRMARELRTEKGRSMYAKRKEMTEPIFGQRKRALGFRRFSMRGLASMRGEWRLMATVHNLWKVWRNDQMVEMAG